MNTTAPAQTTRRLVRVAELAIVAVLGFVQAWANRFYMNPDGVAYLNLSRYYEAGDYAGAVSTYWSPLYPWVIAQATRIVQPAPYWEAPLVHVVNFVIYFVAFLTWSFFSREFLATLRKDGRRVTRPLYEVLSLAFFLWCSQRVIGLALVTPDMLVAAIAFAACGLFLRVARDGGTRRELVVLGLISAVGYLAKAVMFPAALLILTAATIAVARRNASLRRIAFLLVPFVVISAPQLLAVSREAGRVTFAETGRLAYGTMVNGNGHRWPETRSPQSGIPLHPVRKIHAEPDAYVFPSGSQDRFSTYPLSDDPAYWHRGMEIRFDISDQARATVAALRIYAVMTWFLVAALIPLTIAARGDTGRSTIAVPLVAFGMLAMYALVYVEPRHAAPWLALLLFPLLVALSAGTRVSSRKDVVPALVVVASILLLISGRRATADVREFFRSIRSPFHFSHHVAENLSKHGVAPGSRVAVVGNSDWEWARLSGITIVGEVPNSDAPTYWASSSSTRAQIDSGFAAGGAGNIVAERGGQCFAVDGWVMLGNTGYCLKRLR